MAVASSICSALAPDKVQAARDHQRTADFPVPARGDELRKRVALYAGFSLQADIGVEGKQRKKLEMLTRYVSRPPVAIGRLNLAVQGQIRYECT